MDTFMQSLSEGRRRTSTSRGRDAAVPAREASMNSTTIPFSSSVVGVAARDPPRIVPPATAVEGATRRLLRAEAALVFAGAVTVFHHLGGSWWVFVALFFGPDLSFIGYLAGPRTGA